MSTWQRILGVLVLGFLMCVGNSGTASAHSDLTWSYPEQGASVPAPPAQVVLRMSSPVSEELRKVEVRDGSGRTREISSIHTARDGSVVVTLDGTGARGTWRVDYRLVAADGHPITGDIQFAVGEEMLKARQAPEGSGTVRWLSIAGGTTVLLAAVVLLQRTGSSSSRRQRAE
jgi:methionine-rich copper-binding protein CopC